METDALTALGRLAALERVVGALIATHPNARLLATMWQDVSPGWRQDLQAHYGDPAAEPFLTAAMKSLDRFQGIVHAAAASTAQRA